MALFSTIRRGSGRRSDAPASSAALLPWHAFDAAIERSLRMLRGVHVPVSLFALALGDGGRIEAGEIAAEALSQFGPVGRLIDGRIGLLYLGPRSPNANGDSLLTSHVFSRVEKRLQERGWGGLCRSLELAAVHGWTDEISGAADLLRSLVGSRDARRPLRIFEQHLAPGR